MVLKTCILLLAATVPCYSQTDDTRLGRANNQFGLNVLKQLSSERPGGNVFFSPSSVSAALTMVYAGAGGQTLAQLSDVLGFAGVGVTDRESVLAAYKRLLSRDDNGSAALEIANAVLVRDDIGVSDSYKNVLADVFSANLRLVNFVRDGAKVASEINQWVLQKTSGKIPKIVGGGLPMNTAMILLNAVYFKGTWKTKFDPNKTAKLWFYNHGTTMVTKDTMTLRAAIRHTSLPDLNAEAVELPYKGARFSMVIVLPNSKAGLPKLRETLSAERLEGIHANLFRKRVDLKLPKFTLETEYEMVQTLQKLGLTSVFGENADLSGVTGTNALAVSDVMHKAVVEVNEEGTVAAAATAIRSRMKSFVRTVNFHVDHPFLFYIRDKLTSAIWFIGEIHTL